MNANLQKMVKSMEMERTLMQNELDELSASANTLEESIKSITATRYILLILSF